jgi:5-methylcytosine-specific restriction endonuclease McrA
MKTLRDKPHNPRRPRMTGRVIVERDGYGESWPSQRARAYKRAGGRVCEKCGSKHGCHVHHKRKIALWYDHETGEMDYDGANSLENLIVLCTRCHKAADGHTPLQGFTPLDKTG